MQLLTYGHSILRDKTKKVESISEEIIETIVEMYKTMYECKGKGLAANQIGVSLNIITIDNSTQNNPEVPLSMINPEIVSHSADTKLETEKCLSLPQIKCTVPRWTSIQITYTDVSGELIEAKNFKSSVARTIQHEVDHLDGKLIIDYVRGIKRNMLTNKLKRIRRKINGNRFLWGEQEEEK